MSSGRAALAELHAVAARPSRAPARPGDDTIPTLHWGPLQPLLDDPEVEELWFNEPSRVFYASAGMTRLSTVVMDADEAHGLVLRAVMACGRRLDTSHPFVDVQLPDGSRLHVAIPPITPGPWAVNIRRHLLRPTALSDLVAVGMLPGEVAGTLERACRSGANVIVSGGTHTGKTTFLNALLGAAVGERVITCEEVRELTLAHADWVPLQTRDPGLEGTVGVSLRDLVRESLRMRPQRLVVGEVRGAEALDLLLAMNSGVPAAGTLHANSAEDAVVKLTGLPLLAGPNISPAFVAATVAQCVDVVVHLRLTATGRREVAQICSVAPGPDGHRIGQVFRQEDGRLVRGGAAIPRSWEAAA